MKKIPVIIILLISIIIFSAADYYLNNLKPSVPKDISGEFARAVSAAQPEIKPESLLQKGSLLGKYKVKEVIPTDQIFEKIDLSNLEKIKVFKDEMVDEETGKIVIMYEIQGPPNQGSLTYLMTKLQFLGQIGKSDTEDHGQNINETGEFGNNSFFYNNKDFADAAHILVQIKDDLFGFQYSKTDSSIYEDVKNMINDLM